MSDLVNQLARAKEEVKLLPCPFCGGAAERATHQHYKGGYYRVITYCKHSETQEDMVVYECCKTRWAWVRPRKMFDEVLPDGTPRFLRLR